MTNPLLYPRACNTCGVVKPIEGFYPRCARCKVCFLDACRAKHAANPSVMRRRVMEWKKSNPDKVKVNGAAYRERHREKIRKSGLAHYYANRERLLFLQAESRKRNVDRIREYNARWDQENKDKANAKAARRRAQKMLATPTWADKEKILAFYSEAQKLTKQTGVEHHVDHIVPLISKMVCGLHVEHNLRVVPAVENLAKFNKFRPGAIA